MVSPGIEPVISQVADERLNQSASMPRYHNPQNGRSLVRFPATPFLTNFHIQPLWCNGYGMRLVIWRSWVRILPWTTNSMASTICLLIGEVTITSWEVMVTWEVIITSNNVTICSLLQVTVTSKNFQKFFSISNDVKLPKMPKKSKKKISKILKIFIWEVTITSNDSYHLLVNSSNGHFSQSDHHFLEVTTRW